MDFLDDEDGMEDMSAADGTLMTLEAELEPTLSVREVNDAISQAIDSSFRKDLWVKGEIQRLNFHSSGHIYFNLVDSGSRGSGGSSIPVSLFKNTISKIKGNLREILAEDREIRIKVRPNFYAPYGKMSLIVNDLDTAFTLGQIAIARRQLLEKLNREGILRANASFKLDGLPTNIVLVTALDSAAYHDVTDQLKGSGFGFHVRVVNALMQGNDSARSVSQALKQANTLGADVVLLCRGGGAKSDLSSFDSEVVARTICSMTTPVLTGLGHQIDVSVADMVAHSSVKTPTACAQYLIERVRDSIDAAENAGAKIADIVIDRLNTADQRLAYIQQRLSDSSTVLERCTLHITAQKQAIHTRAQANIDLRKQQLNSWSLLVNAHDPQRVLERGYSLTTNSQGELVASIAALKDGEEINTRLADGDVTSTVTKVKDK